MAHEPEEMIKQQMLETRAALADKLETLEQQVVGTVHSATSAVTDTVACVKEAVQQTVESARESVHGTVEAVKGSLDVAHHVREHPWLMMAGSVAVGYAGAIVLHRVSPTVGAAREEVPTLSTLGTRSRAQEEDGQPMHEPSPPHVLPHHGVLGDLGQKLEPEINRLKALVLGTALGIARDMISNSAPPALGAELANIIDSATVKLGGQPIQGPLLHRDGAERPVARW